MLMLAVAMTSALAESVCRSDHQVDAMIIGDNDREATDVGSVAAYDGTWSGCSNSHGSGGSGESWLDFHHDGGRHKGSVAVRYAPVLKACGCYKISEWHPGGPDAPSCSFYLPRRAPVHVQDASGVMHTITVDQSVNGGRWNAIGTFDLRSGTQNLVASNEGTTECARGFCYWIA